MKTKGVIFDIDGLMVDSEILFYEIIGEVMAESGYTLTMENYLKTVGLSVDNGIRIYEEIYPGMDARKVFDARSERYPAAIEAGRLKVKPGLLKLLDELEKRGLPYAVASSNDEVVVQSNLRGAGVAERVKTIVHAGMVERVKPFPDLFLKAAELLGLEPGECLVLEDSAAGIRAAHAAGIPAIQIPDLIEPTQETLDLCLKKMDTLYDVIEFLNQQDMENA